MLVNAPAHVKKPLLVVVKETSFRIIMGKESVVTENLMEAVK